MNGRLPDFVIIGAIRSGTTSLARYLGSHPDIYMARQKEVHYFDSRLEKGAEWYASQFGEARPSQACGEATPAYMSNRDAMRQMSELIPQARLIAILREPASRAWSHYWMRRERKRESRDFEQAIAEEVQIVAERGPDGQGLHYLNNGMYAHHLGRALNLYQRERLHVVVFERMLSEPNAQYQAVCRFLGVNDEMTPRIVGRPINSYLTFRSLWLRNLSKRMPRQISRMIGRLNARTNVSYPEIDAGSRDRLSEFFRSHNEKLEKLLDLELDEWAI